MATNRYPATCTACNGHVPANGGTLHKAGKAWTVRHLACDDGKARVLTVRFSSGHVMTRNSRGTCEDAPACGCCSG